VDGIDLGAEIMREIRGRAAAEHSESAASAAIVRMFMVIPLRKIRCSRS
jgi:hypothetical protein